MSTIKNSAAWRRPQTLFIGGSMNQTTQVYQVAQQLPEVETWFSPHYATGVEEWIRRLRLAEFTVIGRKHVQRCLRFLREHELRVDYRGTRNDYDLVVTSSDLVMQHNILGKPIVLVQEGITDPEGHLFRLVRRIPGFPRWLAGTATNGLSHQYSRFCVASAGYRDLFIRKGVDPRKIRVTGIPNFDSTVYVALALGKEVHCDLDLRELRELVPDQHGRAAVNIADVCRELLASSRPQRTPQTSHALPSCPRGMPTQRV